MGYSLRRATQHMHKLSLSEAADREQVPKGCNVIMFSGGRDSTLAALRSHQTDPLVLVTIAAPHLIGLDLVRRRLGELSQILPSTTLWIVVRQPNELATDTSFYEQTCLPCHHAYVVVGSAVAAAVKARTLTFGYVGYQNVWPEQTPLAINSLRNVLEKYGIELALPVQDIASRDDAIAALDRLGIHSGSLEQKCIRQVTNVELDPDRLRSQVELWESAIGKSLAALDQIAIEVLEVARLGAFND